MITRRTLLRTAASAGALSLAAPSLLRAADDWDAVVAAAKKEGQVALYSSGVARAEEPRMAAFKDATGIAVNYARPGGGEIVIRKYEQEIAGGAPQADICTLTDVALGLYAQKQGWTAEVDLPNMADLAPQFEMTVPGVIPTGAFGMVIVANRTMVADADMPKTYSDLLDPKWKGQVLFGAPENAGSTTVMIKGLVERHGWDFVAKLRANDASEMRLQAEAMQAVARGEKPICVVAQAWGFLYQQQGAPTQMIFPTDGTIMASTCMFVSAKAQHPNAARVLANHILSPEYQAIQQATGSYPSNAKAELAPGIPPLDSIPVHWPNLVELEAQRGEIIDKWRAAMG